ncbi:MAG: pyrroline-5-carboxylate reductase dimerization domain-containing protein [Bacteriovorax sp.]|nr:pyrroline-5-carboxylate reductase dimerization domain-containing protein [Bacteriovorax sp.]
MANLKIGVFGCGNMGRALVQAMNAQWPKTEFFLYTPSITKAQDLAQVVGGVCLKQIEEMPKDLDWYLLAFKPQSLGDFQFSFNGDSKIISVLAGVKVLKLSEKFKVKKIARLMPNTPSALGAGANLHFFNTTFNPDEIAEIYSLLQATGKIFPMSSEEDLDISTAFSGSGPALIFELARIFESELTRLTEGRVPAKEIIAQTFFGSSTLMNSALQKEISFEELRNQVTSKKGVTYEALEVLQANKLQSIFASAFAAAYKRTLELSK